MQCGPENNARKLRHHGSKKKSMNRFGLSWAFLFATIFGVYSIDVPMALAQQHAAAVDNQGPVIGM
jgi:hypothetical protein